jgi:hypothetical protein
MTANRTFYRRRRKMAKITTKAIDSVIADKVKLNTFTVSERDKNKFKTEEEYVDFVSRTIFTVISLEKSAKEYKSINYISRNSQADIAYLVEKLTETKEFENYQFKIVPIVKLYESLLKENWNIVQKDRDILDEIGEATLTPDCNVAICDAIIKFLKEQVLEKSNTFRL